MLSLSYYNPLKRYDTKEHIEFLNNIISHYNDVCFIGDEIGYFFSPFRGLGKLSIVLEKDVTYNFFSLIKEDPYMFKHILKKYVALFKFELIEYFEKQVFIEKDPIKASLMLMALTNTSSNIDLRLSNYSESNVNILHDAISKLDTYYVGDNKIYKNDIPDTGLLISYNKDFKDRDGILITSKTTKHNLVHKIDNLNYYFVEGK